MNLLLSYPRSGNTWFRYCVEALTKKQTHGYLSPDSGHFDKNHLGSYVDLGVNPESPDILIKRHAIEKIEGNIDKLILLIRDYKEVIIRHRYESWKGNIDTEFLRSSCTRHESSQNYLTMIQYFDSFRGDKLLVYYEDLITNPLSVLERATKFLGYGEENIDSFMDEIETHRSNCLKVYGVSKTGGTKIKHHSNILDEDKKMQWDLCLKDLDPEIYSKYLERYSEKISNPLTKVT